MIIKHPVLTVSESTNGAAAARDGMVGSTGQGGDTLRTKAERRGEAEKAAPKSHCREVGLFKSTLNINQIH